MRAREKVAAIDVHARTCILRQLFLSSGSESPTPGIRRRLQADSPRDDLDASAIGLDLCNFASATSADAQSFPISHEHVLARTVPRACPRCTPRVATRTRPSPHDRSPACPPLRASASSPRSRRGRAFSSCCVGFGLLAVVDEDIQTVAEELVRTLHLNPAKHLPRIFLEAVERAADTRLWMLAAFALELRDAAAGGGLRPLVRQALGRMDRGRERQPLHTARDLRAVAPRVLAARGDADRKRRDRRLHRVHAVAAT